MLLELAKYDCYKDENNRKAVKIFLFSVLILVTNIYNTITRMFYFSSILLKT